jgi:hypothetical protein
VIDTTLLIAICTTSGAVGGTAITSVVNHFSNRTVNKAQASELITDAAQTVTRQFAELNRELGTQVTLMRSAILLLTEIVDQIAPLVEAPEDVVFQLKQANQLAKLAYMGLEQEHKLISQVGRAAREQSRGHRHER